MSPTKVYLGLDCGTQSTKAVLYNPTQKEIIARASAPHDLDPVDNTKTPGRAEQHPHKWIKALHTCMKEISSTLDSDEIVLAGIGVSGQQHGMVPLDDELQVIRSAKLWCDVEAADEAQEYSEKATSVLRDLLKQDCSVEVPAGFTAPKSLWFKRNEPELFAKLRWLILPHDYINLVLETGIGYDMDDKLVTEQEIKEYKPDVSHLDISKVVPSTDAGDASGSGYLHPSKPEYVKELTDIIDEDYWKKLPKVLGPNEVSGYLSKKWKEILGIATDTVVPISVGTGDNMASAMGCKCIEPGTAVMSLGTSGTIFGVSTSPVKTGTAVLPFNDATGNHLPLVCIMSCTAVLNSVLEHWCSTSDQKLTHEEATKLAGSVPAGCNGLTFLPYLGGERTPNWPHSFGALLGVNAQNMNCMNGNNAGIMYRCAMEGITYTMANALEEMRKSCGEGFQPKSIMVVGGGSKNKFWRQMLADVMEVELTFPTEPESAALGAAFQAGVCATGIPVNEYISQQTVAMEDCVVTPSTDESKLQLYRDAFASYKLYANKLFG